MKTGIKIKAILAVLLITIMAMASSSMVFASTTIDNYVKQYYVNGAWSSDPAGVQGKFSTSSVATGVVNSVTTVTPPLYYLASDETAIEQAITNANTTAAANAGTADDTLQKVSNIDSAMKISADTDKAAVMFSGVTGAISLLIGIIVVLISLGMTIFSAFDLCYIAFPVFRGKCDEAKQNGGNNFMTKQGKGGESKLRWVTDEAQYAVIAADTTQSGKNPFVIYFGKRLLSYIVLAVLLFILLSGNITIFTSLAIKIASGVMKVIASF